MFVHRSKVKKVLLSNKFFVRNLMMGLLMLLIYEDMIKTKKNKKSQLKHFNIKSFMVEILLVLRVVPVVDIFSLLI